MTVSLDQLWLTTFGLAAIVLVNMTALTWRRWGPIMGLLSQPGWFYATYQAEQWGIFALSFVYAATWAVGGWNMWVKA